MKFSFSLFIFLFSLKAFSYKFTSDFNNGFYWSNFPLQFQVKDTNLNRKTLIESIVAKSMEEWESATGFSIWTLLTGNQSAGHIIRWSTNFTQETGMNSFSTLAVTIRYSEGPYFVKSEIVINGENSTNLNPSNLATVITHELGHTIGLDHSENPQAVMYGNLVLGYQGLSQDDINGMSEVFFISQKRQAEGYVSPLAFSKEVQNSPISCASFSPLKVNNEQSSEHAFLISFLSGVFLLVVLRIFKFTFLSTIRKIWKS